MRKQVTLVRNGQEASVEVGVIIGKETNEENPVLQYCFRTPEARAEVYELVRWVIPITGDN